MDPTVSKIFFENYCKNFLEGTGKYECNEELLNTGLETVSIHILENSRKLRSQFEAYTTLDKSTTIDLINGSIFTQLEYLIRAASLAYTQVTELCSESIFNLIGFHTFLNNLDIIWLIIGAINANRMVVLIYIKTMNRNIKRNKEMENLIPTSLIMKNEGMMAFIFGEEREEEKRRRKEKRRRRRYGGGSN